MYNAFMYFIINERINIFHQFISYLKSMLASTIYYVQLHYTMVLQCTIEMNTRAKCVSHISRDDFN